MNFELTPDQTMLADSVDKFCRAVHPTADRPRLIKTAGREGSHHWRAMADLGWLLLPIDATRGGFDGVPTDIMVVAEGLGRHLLPEPFVSSAVVAAPLMAAGPQFEAVAAGTARIALALGDGDSRFDDLRVSTTAKRVAAGWQLSGTKHHVADGADADWFIVPARSGDAATLSLFLVPAKLAGLTVGRFRSADNRRNATLDLQDVVVAEDALIDCGGGGGSSEALERAVQRGVLALCAEAVGAMDTLRDITLEYLKTRRQFGTTIGSFQALQHRMVDIAMQCEEARAITYRATLEFEAGIVGHQRMASAAKARVGQAGLFVGRQATQLHGGVGTTDELVVSHYYKRLMAIDLTYGNADYHRARFGAMA